MPTQGLHQTPCSKKGTATETHPAPLSFTSGDPLRSILFQWFIPIPPTRPALAAAGDPKNEAYKRAFGHPKGTFQDLTQ